MATEKQKSAARRNLEKARKARSARARGASRPAKSPAKRTRLSTAAQNDLPDSKFAFPEARKEPLTDARHVRNAIASFDQVEGVSDAARDRAWKRIRSAAKKYDIEVSAKNWRDLFSGGKAKKKR